jgi:hypothetical protein
MNIATEMTTFFNRFLDQDFKENDAVQFFGKPTKKTSKQWHLKPKNPDYSEIRLNFEDLLAGKGLLTAANILFKPPLKSTLTDIKEIFGESFKWVPMFDSHRPRAIAFHKKTELLNGTVLVNTDAVRKTTDSEDIHVYSILFRRYFPAPLYTP